MDLILNPIFILLLTFAGFCSFVVLTFIKWRHQRSGSAASTTGILHHDLTKGRFGPIWSSAISASKIIGIGLLIYVFSAELLGHFTDHRTQWEKERDKYREGLAKNPPAKTYPLSTPMFSDLDKQLAERAREVANQTPGTGRRVGLRKDKQEFVSFYGEPLATSPSNAPPASTAVGFEHDDLAFVVSFWKDVAHEIDICRKDGKKLTDQNVRWGLGAFSNGGEWRVAVRSSDGSATEWDQENASASLITGEMDKSEVYVLRILTDEFLAERSKLDSP